MGVGVWSEKNKKKNLHFMAKSYLLPKKDSEVPHYIQSIDICIILLFKLIIKAVAITCNYHRVCPGGTKF